MKSYVITVFLILITAVASMLLPDAALKWQDSKQVGQEQMEESQEVILTEQASMALSQKLNLIWSDTVSTLALVNGKNYTEDTIEEKLKEEVEKLSELGILKDFDASTLRLTEAGITFYMDMEDSENSAMLWSGGAYIGDYQLSFMLDDESGKLLGFSIDAWEFDSMYSAQWSGTEASSTEDGSMAVERVPEDFEIEGEELEELGEKWGEYLGCQVLEISRLPGEYAALQESDKAYVDEWALKLRKKGYSEEEAYIMALEALGFPIGYWDNRLSVTLEDEAGTLIYNLYASTDELQIYYEKY